MLRTTLKRTPLPVVSFEYIYDIFFIASFHTFFGSDTFYNMVLLTIKRETLAPQYLLNKVKCLSDYTTSAFQ